MILSIIVLGVIMVSTLLTIGGSQVYFSNTNYSAEAEKATALAEAGLDKAVASLNKSGGTYSGESETAFGDGTYSVTISSKDVATKTIESIGFMPNKADPRVKRTVRMDISKGIGVSFVYGIQVGEGGLALGNSNVVSGSIYSNGNVTAGNNNQITGDVWVAGGPQVTADQSTDCTGNNCQDYIFGKTISSESRLNVSQSFKPSTSGILNKISLKLKKIGNPADATVRLLRDDNSKPDKNGVLASGTLFSNLMANNYGFIDVTFTSSPNVDANTTYWLMISTSSDNNNYFSWQNDLALSYSHGNPKWSANWQSGNPTWTIISGDLSFQTFMGGAITKLSGGNNFTIGGDAHANTIENATIVKDAYYQTIINSTALNLHPGTADPPPKVFPISDANISEWKQQAESNGISNGSIDNCVITITSKKIVGNVNFNSNCIITIHSPLWVTGSFNLNSNNTLKLDTSYGVSSGVIIVDGVVDIGSNNKLLGTGIGSSILMFLSTYDSRASGVSAIKVNNTGNSGVLYADKGIIEPGNGNSFKELTGWGIKLVNNSTITYDTGLSSSLFTSGPSGSYSLVKGTYQVR